MGGRRFGGPVTNVPRPKELKVASDVKVEPFEYSELYVL